MKHKKCIICGSDASRISVSYDLLINCCRCGEYLITTEFEDDFDTKKLSYDDISKISGWIRENQKSYINEDAINRIRKIDISVYTKAQEYKNTRIYKGSSIDLGLAYIF